jgi:hypothetical protein
MSTRSVVAVVVGCAFLSTFPVARASYTPTSAPTSQPSNTFTLGKDTTRITRPLRADGTVDYVAALNAQTSQGVTPAINAAAGLVRTLGPRAFDVDEARRAKLFELLGTPPLPEAGNYYVGPEEYTNQNGQGDEAAKSREDLDKLQDKPWTAAEYPLLGRWITSQDAALTDFANAAALPKFYLPMVPKGQPGVLFGAVGPGLTAMRSAGRALAYRANFRLGNRDFDGFRSDAQNLSRLARLLATRPLYIDYLVATGLDALAVQVITGGATSGSLTAQQARALLADVDATPPMPSAANAFDLGERYIVLDYFGLAAKHGWARAAQMFAGGGRARPLYFAGPQTGDWDTVLRKANSWYDRYTAVVAARTHAERQSARVELDKALGKLEQRTHGPLAFMSPPEDRILGVMQPSLRVVDLRKRNDLMLDMCRLALALAAYHADHGKYPTKLSELSPKYLAKLPPDVFAKNSPDIMYDVNALGGYRLASVGENGTDDRERAAQSFKVDDLVVLGGKQPPPRPRPKEEFELQLDAADAPAPAPVK